MFDITSIFVQSDEIDPISDLSDMFYYKKKLLIKINLSGLYYN